jgi:hypothetical protein
VWCGGLTGGRVRPSPCRLYPTKATSGRMYQIANPHDLWISRAGAGRRCRLSTRKATWRARLCYSHQACAGSAVLRQDRMFSGRRLRFSGMHRMSFALCVRSNLLHSQVGRRMFSRAYKYVPRWPPGHDADGHGWRWLFSELCSATGVQASRGRPSVARTADQTRLKGGASMTQRGRLRR